MNGTCRIAAVLLAAGASTRFGTANKLLAEFGGAPMLRHVAEAIRDSGVHEIVVVTGYERESYVAALDGIHVGFVHNADWQAGLGGSVAAGVAAVSPECEAAFIVPGDMPRLPAEMLRAMCEAYRRHGHTPVVVPVTKAGEQRNPVLWPRRYFSQLAALSGEQGAKPLLARVTKRIDQPFDDALFADVDTPSEYAALLASDTPPSFSE